MNIEDRLSELGLELQSLPEEMNKAAMRKTMTRKRIIHRVGVAARSVAVSLAALLLVLFVGVNTSTSFARAATKVPVIGEISNAIIIRDEIKQALEYHEDLEKPIEAGHLLSVDQTVSSKNYPIDLTLDSIMVDCHAVSAFIKINTQKAPEGVYSLRNGSIINLDTGMPIHTVFDYLNFEEMDKLYLFRFNWLESCSNFAIEFELVDETEGVAFPEPLETYHFEFHNVVIPESRHYPIDKSITVNGLNIYFKEMMVSDTGTRVIFAPFENFSEYSYMGVRMVLEDENGNLIGDAVKQGTNEYGYTGDDGVTYQVVILPCIYYENVEKIRLHILDLSVRVNSTDLLSINPEERTATFNGETFPIEIYPFEEAAAEFGITQDMNPYNLSDEDEILVYKVPAKDGMPDFNSQYFPETDNVLGMFDFPKVNIDGQEYFMIYHWGWGKTENDPCFYFVYQNDKDVIYEIDQYFEVDA